MRTLARRSEEGGRVRPWLASITTVAAIAGLLINAVPSQAANGIGGNFEIDGDLVVACASAPAIDWLDCGANTMRSGVRVTTDLPPGGGDDSFGNGTKEDSAIPSVVDGGIPPNKSDLKKFGVYIEGGKYLNLFWTRVQDPSGTTNMDFEFNQGTALSSNGVTPIRTAGDFLITYDLANGGTVPIISVRKWLASNKWGPATLISSQNPVEALGSINGAAIDAAHSDGVGPLSLRTFGEASIDLTAVFGTSCGRIGSAFLKSRSSDSFTAAVKDFIAPDTGINFNNCPPAEPATTHHVVLNDSATVGGVGSPGTITFHLYKSLVGDVTPCGLDNEVYTSAALAVDSSGTAATADDAYTASTDGIYNWVASYAPGGGSQLLAGSSSCGGERVVLDLTP